MQNGGDRFPFTSLRDHVPQQIEDPEKSPQRDVYYGLRRAIIEQALMPGDKLTEDVIGDRFGVSRTIVGPLSRGSTPRVWWICSRTRGGHRPAEPVGGA